MRQPTEEKFLMLHLQLSLRFYLRTEIPEPLHSGLHRAKGWQIPHPSTRNETIIETNGAVINLTSSSAHHTSTEKSRYCRLLGSPSCSTTLRSLQCVISTLLNDIHELADRQRLNDCASKNLNSLPCIPAKAVPRDDMTLPCGI